MPAAVICDECGKKIRSEYHVCQPSAVEKEQRVERWRDERESSEEG